MTEKEKMLAGKPYKAFDAVLLSERQHTKEMIFDFNSLRPSEMDKGNAILKKLFGRTGQNFFVEPPFRCDYGYNIYIGENFYANYNCLILDCAAVTIGKNVLFAPNVCLYTAGHPIHHVPRNAGFEYAFPIIIGDNVWVGGNVTITPNVSVGDNTVIGSGSVVTKDIPANVVAVGNPCKVIRTITDDDKEYYFKQLKFCSNGNK